jgi:hypothetical protein
MPMRATKEQAEAPLRAANLGGGPPKLGWLNTQFARGADGGRRCARQRSRHEMHRPLAGTQIQAHVATCSLALAT